MNLGRLGAIDNGPPVGRRPGRPPAAESDGTRARIVDCAREVFATLGYDATTFRVIADRLSLTRPCITYHFPSKRLLYQQVRLQVHACVEASMALALDQRGAVAKIAACVAFLQKSDEEFPGTVAFLSMALIDDQRDGSPGDESYCFLTDIRGFLADTVAAAAGHGELSSQASSREVVDMLLAILCGLLLQPGARKACSDQIAQLLAGCMWTISV